MRAQIIWHCPVCLVPVFYFPLALRLHGTYIEAMLLLHVQRSGLVFCLLWAWCLVLVLLNYLCHLNVCWVVKTF